MAGGGGLRNPYKNSQSFFSRENPFFFSSRGSRQRRGEDVVYPLEVSLEELYMGTTKAKLLSRKVICSKCNGKGSKSEASMTCPACQGTGKKVSTSHMGPSMIYRSPDSCNECKGTGNTLEEKGWCPQCKGTKVVQENKFKKVVVEKGMQNDQKITLLGEANEAPDKITGDIVFVLQQKEHPKFKRKGENLFYEHSLSLTEALCGFRFVLTHLDGRRLLVKSNPGEVVKPDQFMEIHDEGMPMHGRPLMKGILYIHFNVEFCDSLSPETIKALEAILPPRPLMQMADLELDECEETTVCNATSEVETRKMHADAI